MQAKTWTNILYRVIPTLAVIIGTIDIFTWSELMYQTIPKIATYVNSLSSLYTAYSQIMRLPAINCSSTYKTPSQLLSTSAYKWPIWYYSKSYNKAIRGRRCDTTSTFLSSLSPVQRWSPVTDELMYNRLDAAKERSPKVHRQINLCFSIKSRRAHPLQRINSLPLLPAARTLIPDATTALLLKTGLTLNAGWLL